MSEATDASPELVVGIVRKSPRAPYDKTERADHLTINAGAPVPVHDADDAPLRAMSGGKGQTVYPEEVFTAEEAAGIFAHYSRHGSLPPALHPRRMPL